MATARSLKSLLPKMSSAVAGFDDRPVAAVGRKPGRPPGRPAGRPPDETRERILNAAEALFADNGFDGTSLRDVARSVDLQTAAVTYHCVSKEELFDSVISRRAVLMTAQRDEALVSLRDEVLAKLNANAAVDAQPIALEKLVRAYVRPFVESASHGDAGWRHYAALMGRLANSSLGTEVISRHYDRTARAYLHAFQQALPGVSKAAVVDGFSFMVAAMLALCADTGRSLRLQGKQAESPAAHERALHAAFDHLVSFLVSGFAALPVGSSSRSISGSASRASKQ